MKRLFITLVGASILFFGRHHHLGRATPAPASFQMQLTREYPKNWLFDCSSDGNLLLLWEYRKPVWTLRLPSRGSGHSMAPSGNYLRVVERSTNRELVRVQIPSHPMYAFFSRDATSVLILPGWTDPDSGISLWRIGTDRTLRWCPSEDQESNRDFHRIVGNQEVLVTKLNRIMKQRISDCSTVGQVEVEPNSSSEVYGWSLKLSPDARYFAYILKSRTVAQVHRVEDLMRTAVLEVPEGLWLEKMDFSPDGKFLLLDAYKSGRERIHSLLLYDVASGKLLRQLAIDVQYAWALSPNGKLLAVGEKVVLRERPRTLHPKVVLYEFPSGVRVGEADFPPVKEPRSNPWIGDVKKIIFTSDGKSIIATTDYTREWALEGRTASSGDGVED